MTLEEASELAVRSLRERIESVLASDRNDRAEEVQRLANILVRKIKDVERGADPHRYWASVLDELDRVK